MSRRLRVGVLGAGTVALAVVAVSLTAYAAGRPASTQAAPRAATPTPAPTLAPISSDKPVAVVAGQSISGASYAALVAQERAAASMQAQQQGSAAPDERQI